MKVQVSGFWFLGFGFGGASFRVNCSKLRDWIGAKVTGFRARGFNMKKQNQNLHGFFAFGVCGQNTVSKWTMDTELKMSTKERKTNANKLTKN